MPRVVRVTGLFYGGLLCAAVVVTFTSEWLFLSLRVDLFFVILFLIAEKKAGRLRIMVEDWFGLAAALLSMVVGWVFLRHASSVEAAPEETHEKVFLHRSYRESHSGHVIDGFLKNRIPFC